MQVHSKADSGSMPPRCKTVAASLVRRADMGDVDTLSKLGARTFRDAYGAENDPDTMKQYLESSFSPECIASELASSGAVFFLAFNRNTPVGYAKMDVDRVPQCVTGADPIRLFRLYVERRYIGTGCGAALMECCLNEAGENGYQTLWLGVWEQNRRAKAFYRHQGFRAVGFQEFLFGPEIQRDLIMVRDIGPSVSTGKERGHA